MKVLMINSVCGTGSTGRICVDLAKELSCNGNDCLICYGRGNGIGYNNTYKISSNISVYMHGLKTRISDKHGLGSKSDTKRLINKILEYSPDVIHLHNLHGYYLNYNILFKFLKVYGKPIVWTLHDCWPFTGHCAYFDFIKCNQWQVECKKCLTKKEYPASSFLSAATYNYNQKKQAFTMVDNIVIVTPSEWLKHLVKKSFLTNYPVIVINNNIDLSVFKPTESEIKKMLGIENKKMILAVSNIWGKRKGIDDIIKLANLLDDEIIVLVGKQLREIHQPKIISIKRTNNIRELAELYSAANFVINPTYEDNYPTVNLEAQACGTPVITYRTGGSIESVPKENIVEQGDVEALYDKIKENESKIQAVKDKCEMANKYMNIYMSVSDKANL